MASDGEPRREGGPVSGDGSLVGVARVMLHPEQDGRAGVSVRLTLGRVRYTRQLRYIALEHDPRVRGSAESRDRSVYLKAEVVVTGSLQ